MEIDSGAVGKTSNAMTPAILISETDTISDIQSKINKVDQMYHLGSFSELKKTPYKQELDKQRSSLVECGNLMEELSVGLKQGNVELIVLKNSMPNLKTATDINSKRSCLTTSRKVEKNLKEFKLKLDSLNRLMQDLPSKIHTRTLEKLTNNWSDTLNCCWVSQIIIIFCSLSGNFTQIAF